MPNMMASIAVRMIAWYAAHLVNAAATGSMQHHQGCFMAHASSSAAALVAACGFTIAGHRPASDKAQHSAHGPIYLCVSDSGACREPSNPAGGAGKERGAMWCPSQPDLRSVLASCNRLTGLSSAVDAMTVEGQKSNGCPPQPPGQGLLGTFTLS